MDSVTINNKTQLTSPKEQDHMGLLRMAHQRNEHETIRETKLQKESRADA